MLCESQSKGTFTENHVWIYIGCYVKVILMEYLLKTMFEWNAHALNPVLKLFNLYKVNIFKYGTQNVSLFGVNCENVTGCKFFPLMLFIFTCKFIVFCLSGLFMGSEDNTKKSSTK